MTEKSPPPLTPPSSSPSSNPPTPSPPLPSTSSSGDRHFAAPLERRGTPPPSSPPPPLPPPPPPPLTGHAPAPTINSRKYALRCGDGTRSGAKPRRTRNREGIRKEGERERNFHKNPENRFFPSMLILQRHPHQHQVSQTARSRA